MYVCLFNINIYLCTSILSKQPARNRRRQPQRQHAATHHNTLQHAATQTYAKSSKAATAPTHCYTLLHTATHCNTLQHTATQTCANSSKAATAPTQCYTLLHTATTHCNTLQHKPATIHRRQPQRQHNVTHCYTLQQHTATHCNTNLRRVVEGSQRDGHQKGHLCYQKGHLCYLLQICHEWAMRPIRSERLDQREIRSERLDQRD